MLARKSLFSFLFLFQTILAHAGIDREVISTFKGVDPIKASPFVVVYYQRENDPYKRTILTASDCSQMTPFAESFLYWAQSFPSSSETAQPPHCECEDSVCAIELTEYFPAAFKTKIHTPLQCNGPNCFNATLIASNFLDEEEIRFSREAELNFYLENYCHPVPLSERQTRDIITLSHVSDPRALHAGVYIANDILFTKAGPSKTCFYSFEHWSSFFSSPNRELRAYRCESAGSENVRSQIIRILEGSFSKIAQTPLTSSEYYSILGKVEILTRILLNKQATLPKRDALAIDGLVDSIDTAKYKHFNIALKNGDICIVSEKAIRAYKKPSESPMSWPYGTHSQLSIGDLVQIAGFEFLPRSVFEPHGFYKIIEIL